MIIKIDIGENKNIDDTLINMINEVLKKDEEEIKRFIRDRINKLTASEITKEKLKCAVEREIRTIHHDILNNEKIEELLLKSAYEYMKRKELESKQRG